MKTSDLNQIFNLLHHIKPEKYARPLQELVAAGVNRMKPSGFTGCFLSAMLQINPFIYKYGKVILVTAVISFSLSSLGIIAIRIRDNFIAGMISARERKSSDMISRSSESSGSAASMYDLLSEAYGNVMGDSDAAEDDEQSLDDYVIPTSRPVVYITDAPVPTQPPLPTYAPYVPPTPTSAPDCSGIPTAYNSQAMVSATVSTVNNPVTIEIQLLDCHNNFAPVNDDLKVSLSNSDGTARINGVNPPVYLKAQNGKAAVTVNSQINITDTFIITDTTRQFNVTDPRNRNPSVTFSNNSSGNSNCTTAPGVANFWYSNIYPASPQTSAAGKSFSFNVQIKDCGKNIVPGDRSLNITLVSGDSSATVNGHSLPFSTTAHSGQINLSINSDKSGTVTIAVYDSSGSFYVTDQNNRNPGVNFTSQPSAPTATPTKPAATSAPTPTPTQPVQPTHTPTPTPQTQPTNSAPTAGIPVTP